MGDKGDKNAARPPEGSLVETRCLIKGPKSAIVPFAEPRSGPKSKIGPGALAGSVPLARISMTLSRHFSLSFIASGRSSELHPVSSHCCWMYVRAGRPAFARPYVGVHRSTLFMSSSLLLYQCPACLVRLTWILFVMGGRWPYSLCLVGCCRQDLFNIARNILV